MFGAVRQAKMVQPVLFVGALAAGTIAAMIYSFWPASADGATTNIRSNQAPRVLSMTNYSGIPDVNAPSAKIDVLSMKLYNHRSSNFVKFTLYDCLDHALNEPPTVLKVSDSATYLPKPFAEWRIPLRPGASKVVVFNIRHTYRTRYCAARVVKNDAYVIAESN
jgi:hypothetical protein